MKKDSATDPDASPRQRRILIADDDADFWGPALAQALRAWGDFAITGAATEDESKARFAEGGWDLVLLDNNFAGDQAAGLRLLSQWSRATQDTPPIVMFSELHDPEFTVKARLFGASDYAAKSQPMDEVASRLVFLIGAASGERKTAVARQELARECGLVYSSSAMDQIVERIRIARAHPTLDVLILGEPGTGKELVAAAIQAARPEQPFIKVNCGALAKGLLESELFGHARGAFTGASLDKMGKFEAADGGIIFLDEIGTLSPEAQIALLRVLENREVTRLGTHRARPIKVRVIAATNEDLERKVAAGEFRRDLLSRLGGFSVTLPPLRQRREDLPQLVDHLLKSLGPTAHPAVDQVSLEVLAKYDWPDNVRGLRNVLQAAVAYAAGGTITIRHLPDDFLTKLQDQMTAGLAIASEPTSTVAISIPLAANLDEASRLFFIQFVEAKRAMLGTSTKSAVALALGVPRPTLVRKLKEAGVSFAEPR